MMEKPDNNFEIFYRASFFYLSLAFVFGIFIVLYQFLNLPMPTEIVDLARKWYLEYGVIIITLAAFLEGFFMLSLYFPGSLIIVIAVIVSDKSFSDYAVIECMSIIGFTIANIVNYYLGKYGLYKFFLKFGKKSWIENIQTGILNNWFTTVFISGLHPNYLSISMVAMGISGIKLHKTIFASLISLFFWVTLWLLITYPFLDKVNISDKNQAWYIVLGIVIWGVLNGLIALYRNKKRLNKKPLKR